MNASTPSCRPPRPPWAFRILRLGAAFCFIGHGAFGFITKSAWIPYFSVVGIPEPWGWALMPWIGAVDVLAGMAVLFSPSRLPLLYMVLWAAWTAVLRPLAGESPFETLERAGNYGVPLALLVLCGASLRRPGTWVARLRPGTDPTTRPWTRTILAWTTALLLVGHGALAAVVGKELLVGHYALVGVSARGAALLGWMEIGLGLAVLVRPRAGLLLFVALWKVATESLFLVSGAPVWEFVERAGSYAAPLALALLLSRGSERVERVPPASRPRGSEGAEGTRPAAAIRSVAPSDALPS